MIRPLEALPTAYEQRLLGRRRAVSNVDDKRLGVFESVIIKLGRWKPGSTVTCSFSGGSNALRQKIVDAATTWENHGNIKFSFRNTDNSFREWTKSDLSFASDIRISFDLPGYWSLVGGDSVDTSITSAGEASMNFSGFVQSLPQDYAATVLHEFGHALGFEHEHQSPVDGCDAQFRWEDDPHYQPTTDQFGQYVADSKGRRPGIYTVLGGPPNNWQKWKVDHNLRQLQSSSAFISTDFDAKSIMKYFFEPWMFVDGMNCTCYSAQNNVLSEGDIKGMAAAYPAAPASPLNAEESSALDQLLSSDKPAESLRSRLAAQRSL